MRKRSPEVAEMELEPLTSLFRLLSDRTRLKILMLLAQGERNVTSLCDELGLPQPTVSHHLGLLRMNNIIANRRDGKQVFYGLNGCIDMNVENGLQVSVGNFDVRVAERDAVPAEA